MVKGENFRTGLALATFFTLGVRQIQNGDGRWKFYPEKVGDLMLLVFSIWGEFPSLGTTGSISSSWA